MALNLDNAVYTSTDGAVVINLADLPQTTVINAITRALNHVFGNEAIAKVAAKRKTEAVSDDMAAQIIAEAQARYRDAMLNGTWGEAGNRAPRGPAANRLEQIFINLLNESVRKLATKLNMPTVEGSKDTWQVGDDTVTIADLREKFLAHPVHGEKRRADHMAEAEAKHEAEQRASEARKAKAAGVNSITSLDDF